MGFPQTQADRWPPGRLARTRAVQLLALFVIMALSLPGSAALPPVHITIESGSPYFLPHRATVLSGAAIRWDNPTPSPHTVTADSCLLQAGCVFDSGMVAPNQSFTVPGLPPGTYAYHCRIHPIMRGTLTVIAPSLESSET